MSKWCISFWTIPIRLRMKKTEGANLKRENQAVICENLEKTKQKISHELQNQRVTSEFPRRSTELEQKQIEKLEQEPKVTFGNSIYYGCPACIYQMCPFYDVTTTYCSFSFQWNGQWFEDNSYTLPVLLSHGWGCVNSLNGCWLIHLLIQYMFIKLPHVPGTVFCYEGAMINSSCQQWLLERWREVKTWVILTACVFSAWKSCCRGRELVPKGEEHWELS